MKKQERGLFYSQMDNILPIMSEVDQRKIEFVKNFLERYEGQPSDGWSKNYLDNCIRYGNLLRKIK